LLAKGKSRQRGGQVRAELFCKGAFLGALELIFGPHVDSQSFASARLDALALQIFSEEILRDPEEPRSCRPPGGGRNRHRLNAACAKVSAVSSTAMRAGARARSHEWIAGAWRR